MAVARRGHGSVLGTLGVNVAGSGVLGVVLGLSGIPAWVVALVGTGLFLKSLSNAQRIDPGFDYARLAVLTMDLGAQGYDEERAREFERQALERAAALPGVERVTLATGIPEDVCRSVNLGYRDPATIDVATFAADPDTLVVPRAGEVLFRLR